MLYGYDEYPNNLQKSNLITGILKRQVLPLCGLVVPSHPHASENLHKQADIRVDILGLKLNERFISNKHCQVNHTKSRNLYNTSINNHQLIAFTLSHSTWSSCFIYTNWEFLFPRILLSCTIILFV